MCKSIIKACISTVLTVAFIIGACYFGYNLNYLGADSYSDTFTGFVPTETYSSQEETAVAFVSNELNGQTADSVYKSYSIKRAMSSNEINHVQALNLTKKEIIGGKQVEIDYVCNSIDNSIDVYFLDYNDGFTYYIPPQEEGQAVTNSYFNNVLDGSKYANCTSETLINLRLITSEATTDSLYRQLILIDDEDIYFNQSLPGTVSNLYLSDKGNGSIVCYMKHPEKNDGKYYTLSQINSDTYANGYYYYVKLFKGNEQISLDSIRHIDEIIEFIFALDVDASYFIKTKEGFSMSNNKYKDVCKLMAGADVASEIDKVWIDYKVQFRSDYYVSDGRLSAAKTILTMTDGEQLFALNVEVKYSNFGTTVVTIPD